MSSDSKPARVEQVDSNRGMFVGDDAFRRKLARNPHPLKPADSDKPAPMGDVRTGAQRGMSVIREHQV